MRHEGSDSAAVSGRQRGDGDEQLGLFRQARSVQLTEETEEARGASSETQQLQRDVRRRDTRTARWRRLRSCDGYEATQALMFRRRRDQAHGPRVPPRSRAASVAVQPRS